MMVTLPEGWMMHLPTSIKCVLFILEMVIAAQVGLWLFHKWQLHKNLETNNEVSGIIFGAIALIYSLILTFVIVAEWDDYNELDKTIQAETDELNSILAHSYTLPDSLKIVIGTSINQYCNQVLTQEWKMQREKSSSLSAIPVLRQWLLNTNPANTVHERIFDAMDEDLSNISDLQRERLAHTHSQMPPLIWQILKAGTALLILFSYFFNLSSVNIKRVYLSFLVASVSMCMFLVYCLDNPFRGADGISNEPYRNVQYEIKYYLSVSSKYY